MAALATLPRLNRKLSGVDLLVIGFEALSSDEQAEAIQRLTGRHQELQAGTESEGAKYVAGLRQAAEFVGAEDLSWDDYKAARLQLRDQGVELADINRVIRHFGSWRLAKEALQLSEITTVQAIEARFRSRRLSKVWRYTDESLQDNLTRCVADIGRVPLQSEYEWWRQREIELAAAEGNDNLHIPTPTAFRNRWGTWAKALLHFGYSQAEIDGRMER